MRGGKTFSGTKNYPYICPVQTGCSMPTLFVIFGLRFFFYSDEHPPVHVHVEKGDGRAKINIEPVVELAQNRDLKAKDLKKALQLAEMYRDEIVAEWHKFHGE